MEYQTAWDTIVEASRYMFRGPTTKEIVIFLIVLTVTTLAIAVPYAWSRYKRAKEIERLFFERGKSVGLTDEEVGLLWRYIRQFPYDPQLVYDNKALFEKVVSKIIESEPESINLIPSIRTKLRFDTIPWFLPITTTRDIDLYQTGYIIVDGVSVEAAVWDKTETELHIVVLGKLPRAVQVGERVKFSFVRENEGRYSFESVVKDKYTEGDRVILVLEHTDKLERIQLRESFRWKVNIPVNFLLFEDLTDTSKSAFQGEGIIEDISAKGVRVCSSEVPKVRIGTYILMNFELGNHKFENLLGQIVNIRELQTRICFGIKFLKISRQEEKIIEKFIIDEQRKLIKTYKLGEHE